MGDEDARVRVSSTRPGSRAGWTAQRAARHRRAARGALHHRRRVERDLRAPARRRAHGAAPPAAPGARRAATRPCCASTACSPRCSDTDVPHRARSRVCDDPAVLGACFYVMDYVDGWTPHGPAAGAVRRRPRSAREGSRTSWSTRIAKLAQRRLARARTRGLRQAGRLPRAPGRPLARAPGDASSSATLPGLDAAARWLRTHTPRSFTPGHHPRRLPVRQRDVPPRRAGAARRDRRLGDGDDRRPAARPRLGADGLARSGRGPHRGASTSTTPACRPATS